MREGKFFEKPETVRRCEQAAKGIADIQFDIDI